MIYIENNLEKQDVFIPRNDGSTCYVSPYDKGYQDGYQDGIDDCGDCPIQQKEVVLTATTETISPDQGYAGMDSVFVDARQLALEKYNEGYHEGEEDGAEEQKSKLETVTFDRNGEYTREDGWSAVTVDVPKDINLGTLVEAPQMSDITYEYYIKTFDPQEASVDGWGEIRLFMGTLIAQSKDEQKALMSAATFTQNGLYRREDGWNEVIVEVPQTGTSCNLESKTETVTADTQTILPSSGYDGMSEVVVDATDYGQDKYDEGFADGQASVPPCPPCPPCPEIESAVTYGIGSGFTGATITPSSGYDGMAEVTITDNGYGQEKYDEGHGDGYNEGFSDGQTDILSGMTATAFTQNDTYTNASGWSAVTVNVPQTGSSCNLETKSETLTASTQTFTPSSGYDGMSSVSVDASDLCQEKYNEGYQDGLNDCPACPQPSLEQKNVTLTATTECFYPSSGYDGIEEICVDASGIYQDGYNDGYNDAYNEAKQPVALELDGHSWFDTGLYPNSNTKIELFVVPTFYYGDGNPLYFVGCGNGNGDNSDFYISQEPYASSGWSYFGFKFGDAQNGTNGNWNTLERTIKMDYTNATSVLNYNGNNYDAFEYNGFVMTEQSGSVHYNQTITPLSFSSMDVCNYSIFIGANHNPSLENATPSYRPSKCIFVAAKLYDNDVLVGEFVPRLNNGIPCLYDTVSQTYIANSGTGTIKPIFGEVSLNPIYI